jgi:hypothetical protein
MKKKKTSSNCYIVFSYFEIEKLLPFFSLPFFKIPTQRNLTYSDQFNTEVWCWMPIHGFIWKIQFDILYRALSSLKALPVYAYEICTKIYHFLTLNIHFLSLTWTTIFLAYYATNIIHFCMWNLTPTCYTPLLSNNFIILNSKL